jgi:hypothetical protein
VLSSFVAGLGLLCAALALVWLRRLSRALDALKQSYWELRYEYTRLRSRVSRLDPDDDAASAAVEPPGPPATPSVSFVPLSAIRKKDR